MVDIVLLGAPGAGKGTQAELIQKWLPLTRVATGDLFRAALSEGTELGQRARGYMQQGELVPDEVTVQMVAERIAEPDCEEGVIFDGFPRTIGQAEGLATLLEEMGRQVDLVLYVKVSPEVLLERLSGRWICRECGAVYHEVHNPEQVKGVCDECGGELYQREDDKAETQKRRIEVYMEETMPLISYYRDKDKLHEIDGQQSVEAVQEEMAAAIKEVL